LENRIKKSYVAVVALKCEMGAILLGLVIVLSGKVNQRRWWKPQGVPDTSPL
jgi:hypothetical protein